MLSALAVVTGAMFQSASASSLPVPKGSSYLLPAGEHDLRQALVNFGKANGIAVNVSPDIAGTVAGNGQMQPSGEFISNLALRSGLSWFTFRNTVYFARNQDSVEASISVKAAQQAALRSALVGMKLLDDKFSWTELPAQNQVLVFGPRTYVQLIRQQAARLQAPSQKLLLPPVEPTSEAMIFKLRYASAADKQVASNDAMVVRPGVASLLKSLYGQGDSTGSIPRRLNTSMLTRRNLQRPLTFDRNLPLNTVSPINERPTVPAIAALDNHDSLRFPLSTSQNAAPTRTDNYVQELPGSDFETEPYTALQPYRTPDRTDRLPVIEADPRTNSILVRDKPSHRQEYERLIASLDVPIQQIELETILVDMQQEDVEKSLAKLPNRKSLTAGARQGLVVLDRETANALLAYAKAINRRSGSGRADITVLSQTVVFKQDESFNLDFADDHIYPQLSEPIWKRIAAEVVPTASQSEPKVRSTALKITGTANFNEGKIELQAAIEESRNRPDLPNKAIDRRHTALQMSVGLSEGEVCVMSNTSYFTGPDMADSRGRLVLLSARRYGS